MAPGGRKGSSEAVPGTVTKLPPIPEGLKPDSEQPFARPPFLTLSLLGAKVQKRALNRRQLPASSKAGTVYVSSSTPLVSAVKRVRKQLEAGGSSRRGGGTHKNASLHSRVEALKRAAGDDDDDDDDDAASAAVVTVLGAGKAVEKALQVASFLAQQPDCRVEVRTRTAGTVDDVIVAEDDGEDETRVRKMSCLEVSVTLK